MYTLSKDIDDLKRKMVENRTETTYMLAKCRAYMMEKMHRLLRNNGKNKLYPWEESIDGQLGYQSLIDGSSFNPVRPQTRTRIRPTLNLVKSCQNPVLSPNHTPKRKYTFGDNLMDIDDQVDPTRHQPPQTYRNPKPQLGFDEYITL